VRQVIQGEMSIEIVGGHDLGGCHYTCVAPDTVQAREILSQCFGSTLNFVEIKEVGLFPDYFIGRGRDFRFEEGHGFIEMCFII